MLDLSTENLTLVQAILQAHIPTSEVWVFGSRAMGNAKPFSDLDIAILADAPLASHVLIDLKEAFEQSDLPIKVDVVEFYQLNAVFQERIKKHHYSIQSCG
ncbi:MAG: nucleotidyltransferase family protein [Alphaproteobacteria bacterium]